LFKLATLCLLTGILASGAVLAWVGYYTSRTIHDLLGENRNLREALTNLTDQRRIGYAKVLEQKNVEGRMLTRLLFVVTDPEDPTRRVLMKEYEIEGDVVYFDALIIRFGTKLVLDGKERALYLWRRLYGEKMRPDRGLEIDLRGRAPERYEALTEKLNLEERELFWNGIWDLADRPDRLADAGVEAIYGTAVYKRLRPGLIYIFNLEADGTFYPETIPDL
jgi:hypothetical protein